MFHIVCTVVMVATMSEGRSRGKVDKLLSVFVVPYSKEVSLVREEHRKGWERENGRVGLTDLHQTL